jgi:hypothetical protein
MMPGPTQAVMAAGIAISAVVAFMLVPVWGMFHYAFSAGNKTDKFKNWSSKYINDDTSASEKKIRREEVNELAEASKFPELKVEIESTRKKPLFASRVM